MERRCAPRKPVSMSGVIKLADVKVDCLIYDVSISAATIEINTSRISVSIALPSIAAAKSSAFTSSSVFSRLASGTSRPPYLGFHL
jgi:hypothetical protein